MRPTALFRLYRALSALALPFATRRAVAKLRAGGVSAERAHERLGHATQLRPNGPLIWFHGASVGEAKSVLPVLHRITRDHPDPRLLLTSGTATSAEAVAGRMPQGAIHQFSPLDGRGPMARFLRNWRPDLCVLVESELWPNLLDMCAEADIPVALLNARLSDGSAQGWQRFPGTAAYVLRGIVMAHCQDARSRDHLRAMGLKNAQQGANLKSMMGPPMIDAVTRARAHADLGNRPLWVAASTHPGEEEVVLASHARLLADDPDLCLILVPRHPHRAAAVRALVAKAGLTLAQRSTGDGDAATAQIYLADTIGETDLWYTLSPIVFLGGSFTDVGGHTPFEPAAADCAILHGPHYTNFTEAYARFLAADASVEVADGAALTPAVHALLRDPDRAATLAVNARPLVQSGDAPLGELAARLFSLADTHAKDLHD
ncbi:3-deoxy-D-manno-octulosonic acid transferase [uncultured Tateyamaria sp.]|uniref:3-deoxy-D-manno-octulosonic acid transferase n=1 Tax=uncultured Tateyamaria sp. TaxID=455651 RepID=UPI002625A98E|nr:3-deoxy-D-manno-octulosonic acid transferase [uncultured Tateyamaria sp.]